jgi:uronate dehydrogenase
MIILTGAAGKLGRVLAPALDALGMPLRVSDRHVADLAGLPGEPVAAELADAAAVQALCRDAKAIVHFGAMSEEADFATILDANLRGTYNIFEAARAHHARVIFASSHHVVGFHERGRPLTPDTPYRPDSLYGVSKAYGELLARLYFDKHRVESASLRIGSCQPEPTTARHLSTWLSPGDLIAAVTACLTAPALGCRVIWGVSDNAQRWWGGDDAAALGYVPRDHAERAAGVLDRDSPDETAYASRWQGGRFCAFDTPAASTPGRKPGS